MGSAWEKNLSRSFLVLRSQLQDNWERQDVVSSVKGSRGTKGRECTDKNSSWLAESSESLLLPTRMHLHLRDQDTMQLHT